MPKETEHERAARWAKLDADSKIVNDKRKLAEKKLYEDVLSCPMQDNDVLAATVGEYLSLLLSTLWLEDEGFSGKRPFGHSSWQFEVYEALGRAGFVEIEFDEEGYVSRFTVDEEYRADELILQVIKYMGKVK